MSTSTRGGNARSGSSIPSGIASSATSPIVLALEIDLTTPLAYMWSRTDLDRYRWTGLLRPEQALERANLMLIRPYEPGKIPVVMVHGLISTPLAWIPMLNELLRDPVIQSKYQFMLYMYPTGVPIPIAAAGLRESLIQAKMMYDPDGRDPAFEQMVLVGHSMGGLLSRTVAVASGDQFWRLYSDRPFDEILGPREVLDELRRYFFFEPLPFVSRVVFLATPHRGSDMSRGVVGRVGTSLISDPDHIHKLLYQLVKQNPDAFDPRRFRRLPTSIETLEPNSPILTALSNMQPPPPPHAHQVPLDHRVATPDRASISQPTAWFPIRSSHLDGVVIREDRAFGPRRPERPRGHSRGSSDPPRARRRRAISPRSSRKPEHPTRRAPAVKLEMPVPER